MGSGHQKLPMWLGNNRDRLKPTVFDGFLLNQQGPVAFGVFL
jgi:hypothetical protein